MPYGLPWPCKTCQKYAGDGRCSETGHVCIAVVLCPRYEEINLMKQPWVDAYRAWLKQWYSDDDEEVEDIVRQAVQVVFAATELMPKLHEVLNQLSRDDMGMFDGFWRIVDNWYDHMEKKYGYIRG